MTSLLHVDGLRVRLGHALVLNDVSLTVEEGFIVGLVGPNGAGKTTLLDALSGLVPVDDGRITLDGRELTGLPPQERTRRGLGRTFQSLELFEDLDVGENLMVASEGTGHPAATAWAGTVARRLGIERMGRRLPGGLSQGQRRLVSLGRALSGRPRLLLLDEPAAGLDDTGRGELSGHLRRLAGEGIGILLVDHDVGLVLDVCDRVVVLEAGEVIAAGSPAAVQADERVRRAYLGSPSDRELRPRRPPPGRGPALSVRGLCAGYGEALAVRDVDLDVGEGEVVALLGPNGAGKTTTMLSVAGALRRTSGTVEVLGRPVPSRPHAVARRGAALVSQERNVFPGLTVRDNLRLGAAGWRAPLGPVLERFPALGPLLDRPAGLLSGGEQTMLAVARATTVPPRLLMVDEMSSGLAPSAVEGVAAVLDDLAVQHGTAVLVVEQHVHRALELAHRAYVMERGGVVLQGDATDLAARPERLRAAYLGASHDG